MTRNEDCIWREMSYNKYKARQDEYESDWWSHENILEDNFNVDFSVVDSYGLVETQSAYNYFTVEDAFSYVD